MRAPSSLYSSCHPAFTGQNFKTVQVNVHLTGLIIAFNNSDSKEREEKGVDLEETFGPFAR